jgi:hypothetical protein
VNYSNQGVNSPNASTVKDTDTLQEHAGPLYGAPIVVEVTPLKTARPNPTKA